MSRSQDQLFVEIEGDRWFQRNRGVLTKADPQVDFPLRLIELYQLYPRRVLEVGASNGFRVATIAERYGARTVALDASFDALRDGKTRFPGFACVRAEANAIPLRSHFDLIIVNFVLHWVDRANLLRTLAEIDRLIDDGGFLILGDFFPANQTKVRYHHRPEMEVWTYKQNYAAAFLASGLYQVVGVITGEHSIAHPASAAPEGERIAVWLLRKALNGFYVEGVSA